MKFLFPKVFHEFMMWNMILIFVFQYRIYIFEENKIILQTYKFDPSVKNRCMLGCVVGKEAVSHV